MEGVDMDINDGGTPIQVRITVPGLCTHQDGWLMDALRQQVLRGLHSMGMGHVTIGCMSTWVDNADDIPFAGVGHATLELSQGVDAGELSRAMEGERLMDARIYGHTRPTNGLMQVGDGEPVLVSLPGV